MARIPIAIPERTIRATDTSAKMATGDDFGAQIGKAQQQLGSQISSALSGIGDSMSAYQDKADQTAAALKVSEFETKWEMETMKAIRETPPDQVGGLPDRMRGEMAADAQRAIAEIPASRQAKATAHLGEFSNRVYLRTYQSAQGEADKYWVGKATEHVAGLSAALQKNPEGIEAARARLQGVLQEMPLPDYRKREMFAEQSTELVRGAMQGYRDRISPPDGSPGLVGAERDAALTAQQQLLERWKSWSIEFQRTAPAAPSAAPQSLHDFIKKQEGFRETPYWDHKQWSVGYGTRAAGPNDVVDRAEGERRFSAEIGKARAFVESTAPNAPPGVKDALTDLTYNAGSKWAEGGLGRAIAQGDYQTAKSLFLSYNKASGKELPVLTARRAAGAAMFDAAPVAAVPAATAPAPAAPVLPVRVASVDLPGIGRAEITDAAPESVPKIQALIDAAIPFGVKIKPDPGSVTNPGGAYIELPEGLGKAYLPQLSPAQVEALKGNIGRVMPGAKLVFPEAAPPAAPVQAAQAPAPATGTAPLTVPEGSAAAAQGDKFQQVQKQLQGIVDATRNGALVNDRAEQDAVSRAIADDKAQIRATGKDGEIDINRVERAYGPQFAQQWAMNRQADREFFAQTKDIDKLSEAEMQARLNGLKPGAGPDFAYRQKAFEEAQGMVDKAITRRERAIKRMGDDLFKAASDLSDAGKLTPEFIEKGRPFWSHAEYQAVKKFLQDGPAVDKPDAIADLQPKIDRLSPEEFAKDAKAALDQNQITIATFKSYLEKNRAARKDDAPASPHKSGREYVNAGLDPGLLSGAGEVLMRRSRANALIEFDNWIDANPQASRADAVAQAQEIVQRYSLIDGAKVKETLGLSRYMTAATPGGVTIQDVQEAEAKLFADIQAQKLTPAQQTFEIQRLNNWRQVLERAPPAKGAPSGRR